MLDRRGQRTQTDANFVAVFAPVQARLIIAISKTFE